MQNRMAVFLIALFTLLSSSLSLAAESGLAKQNVKDSGYYIGKGNRGEKITQEEFNELMQQLDDTLVDLKIAFSEITTSGANLPHEIGKIWEMDIESTKKNIEAAFKYLHALKTNPNSMISSSALYVTLANIDHSLLYFDKIPHFEKSLGKRHVSLFLWRLAFERAHLLPLSLQKDMKKDLYGKKK